MIGYYFKGPYIILILLASGKRRDLIQNILKKIGFINIGFALHYHGSLSSPPPKSTFFCCNFSKPSEVFLYSINTLLPISIKRPQSQLIWQGLSRQGDFSCLPKPAPKS